MCVGTLQVILPVTGFPEAEAVHLVAAVTERRVAIRCSAQVQVSQFRQIRTNNLKAAKNWMKDIH